MLTRVHNADATRCFLVLTMLLPGHGTRPGDLLDVTRGDWLGAARFGLATLKADAGGFSLGGLPALHAVLAAPARRDSSGRSSSTRSHTNPFPPVRG